MASNTLTGRNITFPIYNADGTAFHDLVLHKATYDSVVMSLGDSIVGDVYYKDNTLTVTMQEYVVYDDVRYVLVNPPTVVREGMVADNGELRGMTKYSFQFFHPMYMLSNFPFSDVAVSTDEERYLAQNKTFNWIGNGYDYVAKLNANLRDTQWVVVVSDVIESREKLNVLSEVLSFSDNSIADALKTGYDTWEVPFVISTLHAGQYFDDDNVDYYEQGKRFVVLFGLPSNEIIDAPSTDGTTVDGGGNVFVFRFGQGVGLKNNSRTPKNNKIVTRLAGYGSTDNIPYGYPQIVWTGDQSWNYTIDNDATNPLSYPIYNGIVGGQKVRLIKHPFTRNHLMPSIYAECVNKKVNPMATGYDPDTVIIDYYDADNSYPNPIIPDAPSYETHEFEDIKPELGEAYIVSVTPYDTNPTSEQQQESYDSVPSFLGTLLNRITSSRNQNERAALTALYNAINGGARTYSASNVGGAYTYNCTVTSSGIFMYVKYTSDNVNFESKVKCSEEAPATWIDDIDDDGNYVQSYMKITLPVLSFDLYASAALTQEMKINMRSGACLGCSFGVYVDWDDYRANFYDADGVFDPVIGEGHPRDGEKYPDSSQQQITVICQKETDTFGVLMPNIYQQPKAGDQFVFIGISLPTSYIGDAEHRLDEAMKQYMLDNNVYYYDYPLKFDEHFLATHTQILSQIRNNTIVRFLYAGVNMALYVKQITIKYGESVLPQYDITLTDDVEIVLNKIGQVTEDVSRVRVQLSELQKYYGEDIVNALAEKLSRTADDIAQGRITFQQGLDAIASTVFHDEIRSPQFTPDLYTGRGWRIDNLGNAEFESAKVRSYLQVVELLVNRMQAQEGDTLFTDNDQIDKVDKFVDETDGSVTYVLSLKEKWEGYRTPQMFGNILKGIANTMAAKEAGVSGLDDADAVETDGSNSYFTSWMRVVATHNTDPANLSVNQIRVVLYGDEDEQHNPIVPAGKNFEPCELMNIARWGCVDYNASDAEAYADEGLDTKEAIDESIRRRQVLFYLSTSEGRIVKLNGVDAPILKNGNYGVTIGELPDFVKQYPNVRKVLDVVGEHTDWLYAQGIVVGNYVKISREGLPVPVTVFCGDWVDGSTVETPTPQNGIYYYNEYNESSQQYEIHEVRHNGGRWQCLQHQPVISGGVATYYEPKWNSPYWRLVDGNDNLTIEFVSSNGYSFRRQAVDTVITPHLFYGNVDITDEVAAEYWTWTRESESGKTTQDETWDAQHKYMKTLHLTNQDMPDSWSFRNKAIFTCTVSLNDGKTTRIVDNQIIS